MARKLKYPISFRVRLTESTVSKLRALVPDKQLAVIVRECLEKEVGSPVKARIKTGESLS